MKKMIFNFKYARQVLVFSCLVFLIGVVAVSATTETEVVSVNATIVGGGSATDVSGENGEGALLPVSRVLEISPALGNVSYGCGDVTITWETNYYLDGKFYSVATSTTELGYGISQNSENIVTGDNGTAHSVTLTGLTNGQTYKYYLKSADGDYFKTNSGGTFVATCFLSNPSIEVISKNQGVEIAVDYPEGEDVAQVIVRRKIGAAPVNINDGDLVYEGESKDVITDARIRSNTTYWYTLFICNGENVCSEGVFDSAIRKIPNVSGLSSISGDQRVSLSWFNPGGDENNDFSYSGVRVVRFDGLCADITVDNGFIVDQGDLTGVTDAGLNNNNSYNYKIFTQNSYGEYSNGVCISGSPSEEAGARCVSNINVLSSDKKVNVSWTNPQEDEGIFHLNNVDWRKNDTCVNNVDLGYNIYSGTDQEFQDEDVVNGQVYAYSSFVTYNDDKVVNCGCITAMPDSGEEEELEIPEELVSEEYPSFSFFTNNGALQIQPNKNNVISVLPGYPLSLEVLSENIPKTVETITARLNKKNYFVSFSGSQNKYQSTINVPDSLGDYTLQILTTYHDETISSQTWTVKVLEMGLVSSDRQGLNKISGAIVTLEKDKDVFEGFGVINPQITSEDGSYGYIVPNGKYKIIVQAAGFKPYLSKVIKVENNVLNYHIDLIKDQPFLQTVGEMIRDPQTIVDNLAGLVMGGFIDNPLVEQINVAFAAPAVVTLAAISTLTAIPWWSLIHYLQFLFTEPLAFFTRKKRKGWGVVYNSITKEPIDLAVVRLYDKQTKKLLQSKITDKDGRYNFLVGGGNYYIEVTKPDFEFPSGVLKNATEDDKYNDLYHGDDIDVEKDQKGSIVANIPVDQKGIEMTDKQILKKGAWQAIKKNISVIGPLFSIVSFIVSPTLLIGVFTLFHVGLYFMFKRLAERKVSKNWGIVYDKESKVMLSKAVVRIFSPEYNKMLDVQITDKDGRYGFLAGNNVYYLTASKDGYAPHKSEDINLKGKKKEDIVGQDLALEASLDKPQKKFKKGKQDKKAETAEKPL